MNISNRQGTDLFKRLLPEKQEKIFQAAVNEFASKGYRNASMNSLVKAAGISKGSLFQYFKTKRNLFVGVVELATDKVKKYLKQVREQTKDLNFFERLDHLLRAGFAFIDQHHLLAKIYFQLLQSGEAPFGTEGIIELSKQSNEFLSDLIKEGISKGELRNDLDIQRNAFLLNALLETLLRAYYTESVGSGLGLYRGEKAQIDGWIKATVDLVRNGMICQDFHSDGGK